MSKEKCNVCKKKLNTFTLFECECGQILCVKHLSKTEHICKINQKIQHQEKLKIQLPKIVKEKFTKI